MKEVEEVVEVQEVEHSKYSNGKMKKEKVKDEPYVEINEQVGKPVKKVERQMRRD